MKLKLVTATTAIAASFAVALIGGTPARGVDDLAPSDSDPSDGILPLLYADQVGPLPRVGSSTMNTPEEVTELLTTRLGVRGEIATSVGGPPNDWRPTNDDGVATVDPAGQRWAHVQVTAPNRSGPTTIFRLWKADVLLGDLREEVHALEPDRPVAGVDLRLVSPGGDRLDRTVTNIGEIAYGQRFAAQEPNVIVAEARSGARTAGVDLVAVRVLHGIQPAVAITVRSGTPERYVTDGRQDLLYALLGSPWRYEGVYLEVQGSDARPAVIVTSAFRTGIGRNWWRPDLAPSHRSVDSTR